MSATSKASIARRRRIKGLQDKMRKAERAVDKYVKRHPEWAALRDAIKNTNWDDTCGYAAGLGQSEGSLVCVCGKCPMPKDYAPTTVRVPVPEAKKEQAILYCPYCSGPLHQHTVSTGYGPRGCMNAPPFLYVCDTPGGEARHAKDQSEVRPWFPQRIEEPYNTPAVPSPGFPAAARSVSS